MRGYVQYGKRLKTALCFGMKQGGNQLSAREDL